MILAVLWAVSISWMIAAVILKILYGLCRTENISGRFSEWMIWLIVFILFGSNQKLWKVGSELKFIQVLYGRLICYLLGRTHKVDYIVLNG